MKKVFINSAIAFFAACALASCAKDNLKPADVETSLHFSITTAKDSPLKSYLYNNLDGTYTPKWSKGDELAMFVGEITSSITAPTAILSNLNDNGPVANFDGEVPTSLTDGSFLSFSPAGAFQKGYTDGTVGINLSEIQNPSSLTFDETCDILVAKPCNYIAEEGTVVIEDLYFKRMFSVLKVNLSGVEALKTEKVKSFTISAPVTLTGRAAVDLSTASISKWYIENKAVTANYSEECPVFGGENGLENTVWLVVNPTTVASGSKVTFSGETENYTFSKEVTLPKDLVFPQSQIAVINLKLGEGNYAAKTTETRIFVEGFDNVKTSKTQLQPSESGAAGTGVTEALAYEYSGEYTNLRFNGNGHSSTNPYLYLSSANDNLIIRNINISGETALKFSCQAKTNEGSATITVNYKESTSESWSEAGTVSAGTGTFDKVNSFVFAVSSDATSLDVQIVTSAAQALVDDLVLESFVDTRSTLSTPANVSVSVDAEIPNQLNISWDAVENASGYEVVLSADGKEDIVKTATVSPLAVSGLEYSTTYSVKVKATTTDFEHYFESAYSSAVSGTTGDKSSTVVDVLVYSLFTATSSTYKEFSNVTGSSNAVYAGQTSYNNGGISLRSTSPSGIVTTTSGGKVKKVVVEWISNTLNGRTIDVYGKNAAYSSSSDLYSTSTSGTKIGSIVYGTSTELTISGDYQYIGIRSNDGALYINSIKITWDESGSSEGGSDPVQLAAPVVSCTAQNENSLTFTWAAVDNAIGYQVSLDEGASYLATQTATEYKWTGLSASTTKTLYVKAVGDGTSYTDSDASSVDGTTTAGTGEESNSVEISMSGKSTTSGKITVSTDKANGSNTPAWTSNELRLYANNSITVSSSDLAISKIELVFHKQGSKVYIESLTPNTGTLTSGGSSESATDSKTDTWTSANTTTKSVVFTLGASGQRVLESVKVYY